MCQHVCRLSPRGEGALRLVSGLQPRRPPPAHHEVVGDQLPLPRRLRPPLRVHLSPLPDGGRRWAGWAGPPALLPSPHLPPCIYFCVNRGPVCPPVPPSRPFCTGLNQNRAAELSRASCLCLTWMQRPPGRARSPGEGVGPGPLPARGSLQREAVGPTIHCGPFKALTPFKPWPL